MNLSNTDRKLMRVALRAGCKTKAKGRRLMKDGKFKEYWGTRGSICYEEMCEAKAAFDFQQKRIKELENKLFRIEDIAHNAPELNMLNYCEEQVAELNDAMISIDKEVSE